MISFLAPFALTGLLALAVPIAIHLLKPRRVRVIPFSSLRWLRASQHRFSRRIQWHQILLFLLRAAFLLLLVLAAARPIVRRPGGEGRVHRFVVVDATRAMKVSTRTLPDPMRAARRQATRWIMSASGATQSTLLIAGNPPRAVGPLSTNPETVLEHVRHLAADGSETPVTSVLRLIPSLHRQAGAAERVELVVLTANLEASWQPSDVEALLQVLDVPVHVYVQEIAAPDTENAWITSADIDETSTGSRRLRVRLGAAGPRRHVRTLRWTGGAGEPLAESHVEIEPGFETVQVFDVPPGLDADLPSLGRLSLEPADALPDDDQLRVLLHRPVVWNVLLVEPETTGASTHASSLHLRTALEALAEGGQGQWALRTRYPTTLRHADLQEADVIFMVEPHALAHDIMSTLRGRVDEGAGLVVFPGPLMDKTFYNQTFVRGEGNDHGLLTRAVTGVLQVGDVERLARWQVREPDHPLLKPLADPTHGDITQARFSHYVQLDEPEDPARETVLMAFADGTPGMIASRFGQGQVRWLNMTANDAWSDVPRRRGFVPLVDGLLRELTYSGGRGESPLVVGKPITYVLPSDVDPSSVRLETPHQNVLPVDLFVRAGRYRLRSPGVTQPGVYRLRWEASSGEKVTRVLPVESGRSFSNLQRMDAETLKHVWHPADMSFAGLDAPLADTARMARGGLSLPDPWLMLLAMLVLGLETVLCCYWCPRDTTKMQWRPFATGQGLLSREEAS